MERTKGKEVKRGQLITLQFTANSYTAREVVLDGRNHLVVPVVMMVEGVHSGSHGPVLHKESELSKNTETWNGIPITITHPREDGNNISANSPEVLEQSVGRIFHTIYNDGLRAEAWIDEEKIDEISPEALSMLKHGSAMEVSVGVFSDAIITEGEWDGEIYGQIATNYRPDHLALLPDEEGACSNDDGCGVRVNKKGVDMKELLQTFEKLSEKGYVVSLINNEKGYRAIQEALQAKLQDLNTEDNYHYVEEVFDNYIIYSNWGGAGGETLYRQDYEMDNESNIVFNGMRSEVRKEVEYVVMSKVRTKKVNTNSKKGGSNMSDSKALCCEAKVDALIANKRTHWQASDREWLLEQEESAIAKMSPMAPESTEQSAEEIQTNKDATITAYKEGLKTIDDYTALMPEEMKAQIDGGVKLYKEHREALVKGIMDNTADGVWTKEALEAMPDSTLENVSKSIQTPADYSGQAAGANGEAAGGEVVELPVEYAGGKEEK